MIWDQRFCALQRSSVGGNIDWLTTTSQHFIQFVAFQLGACVCVSHCWLCWLWVRLFVRSNSWAVFLCCPTIVCMFVQDTSSCFALWSNEHRSQWCELHFRHALFKVRYAAASRWTGGAEVFLSVFKGQRSLPGFRFNIRTINSITSYKVPSWSFLERRLSFNDLISHTTLWFCRVVTYSHISYIVFK